MLSRWLLPQVISGFLENILFFICHWRLASPSRSDIMPPKYITVHEILTSDASWKAYMYKYCVRQKIFAQMAKWGKIYFWRGKTAGRRKTYSTNKGASHERPHSHPHRCGPKRNKFCIEIRRGKNVRIYLSEGRVP